MSNEEIAHDLAVIAIKNELAINNLKLSSNVSTNSTQIYNEYKLYKANILKELNLNK